MKYCTKCGKQLNDDAIFCLGCGCAAGPVNRSSSYTGYAKPNTSFESANKSATATSTDDKEPFSSHTSIASTVLGALSVFLSILSTLGLFLIEDANLIVIAAAGITSIVSLVISVMARRARRSDNLALISIFVSIGGLAISILLAIAYTLITLLYILLA